MKYNPLEDKIFKKSIRGRELSEDTIASYCTALKTFHKATGLTLEEAYENIKNEEKDKITDGYLIRYNPENGVIREYFEELQDYLVEKGRTKSTQNNYQKRLRLIFNSLGLQLPKPIRIKEERKFLPVLRRKDIAYVLNISNVFQKAIYCFQASTGIRIGDSLNFTIDDWLDATFDYHQCSTIEELLAKKCEGNWFGYWEFTPKKTKNSSGVTCKVFNTPESNKYILESIRERIKRMELYNKKNNTHLKIDGEDPLFPSQRHLYKTKMSREALVQENLYKNKRLQEKLEKELKKEFKKGLISKKEYEKKLERVPKWHTHALRHFFITTTRAYLTNRDVGLIMEAHTSDVKTDVNYIGESEEVFNKDMIKKYYVQIADKLTFSYTLNSDEYEELIESESKYKQQLKINKTLIERVNNIDETIKIIDDTLNKKSVLDDLGI